MQFSNSRIQLLQFLITHYGYTRYLEIGTHTDVCFNAIDVPYKIGVDPVQGGTHRMTSDEFFATNAENFQLIFIDGHHHHDQVYTDVLNSLKVLEPNGTIVLHDCFPLDKVHEGPGLCGTAWRAFANLRQRDDLDMRTGDFDHGVGVIRCKQNPCPITLPRHFSKLTYEELQENKNTWSCLCTWDELIKFAS